ncbi:MAG: SCO family protein [Nitrosospira sp.]
MLSRYMLSLAVAFAISSCVSEKTWHVEEVVGHLPDLDFSLTSDKGHLVTAKTYENYILLLYFGFTNCEAECPVSMARLARVMRLLGDNANRTRILFVTLDPGHDTPPVLRRYVMQFDPEHAVGLTGTTDDIQNLTKRYRAAYRPHSKTGGTSGITHGDAVYIFDSEGQARLLATSADSDEDLAEDIRRLLGATH